MRLSTLIVGLVVLLATSGQAAAGAIHAAGAWARSTSPGATTGALYVTLTNTGGDADTLLAASSPQAREVELHAMSMAGGVMRMAPMRLPLPLAAGASLTFAPGANHVMLEGLMAPLKAGGHLRLRLTFAKAGVVDLKIPIRDDDPAGPAAPMPPMKM